MLYKTTIEQSTLELLNKLMSDETLNDFVLVGGIALSLSLLTFNFFTPNP